MSSNLASGDSKAGNLTSAQITQAKINQLTEGDPAATASSAQTPRKLAEIYRALQYKKKCNSCGFYLLFNKFKRDRVSGDGYQETCKKCARETDRKRARCVLLTDAEPAATSNKRAKAATQKRASDLPDDVRYRKIIDALTSGVPRASLPASLDLSQAIIQRLIRQLPPEELVLAVLSKGPRKFDYLLAETSLNEDDLGVALSHLISWRKEVRSYTSLSTLERVYQRVNRNAVIKYAQYQMTPAAHSPR